MTKDWKNTATLEVSVSATLDKSQKDQTIADISGLLRKSGIEVRDVEVKEGSTTFIFSLAAAGLGLLLASIITGVGREVGRKLADLGGKAVKGIFGTGPDRPEIAQANSASQVPAEYSIQQLDPDGGKGEALREVIVLVRDRYPDGTTKTKISFLYPAPTPSGYVIRSLEEISPG